MSRSIKGSKAPGYDYWSPRPYSAYMAAGPTTKRFCNRAERKRAKTALKKELTDHYDMEY